MMRKIFDLPGYLLILGALLRVLIFPVINPRTLTPLAGMTALQAVTLVSTGFAWLLWCAPSLARMNPRSVRRFLFVGGGVLMLAAVVMATIVFLKPKPPEQPLDYQIAPTPEVAPSPPPEPTVPAEEVNAGLSLAFALRRGDITQNVLNQKGNDLLNRYQQYLSGQGYASFRDYVSKNSPLDPATDIAQFVETLGEVSGSDSDEARIIDIWVDGAHYTFQQIPASDKDLLCIAGKKIRAIMKGHHNTVADLNHVQRATYDITAPPGRCK